MKTIFIILFMFLVALGLYSQEKRKPFVNEYSISGNYTFSENFESFMRPGVGLGKFHAHTFNNYFALVFGIEYNMTQYWLKTDDVEKYSREFDVTEYCNYMSIPIFLRLSLGENYIWIFEGGVFGENCLVTIESGSVIHNNPYEGITYPATHYYEWKISIPFNYGFVAGIGIQIPSGKHAIIIKPGFTYGMTIIEGEIYEDNFARYAKLSVIYKL